MKPIIRLTLLYAAYWVLKIIGASYFVYQFDMTAREAFIDFDRLGVGTLTVLLAYHMFWRRFPWEDSPKEQLEAGQPDQAGA